MEQITGKVSSSINRCQLLKVVEKNAKKYFNHKRNYNSKEKTAMDPAEAARIQAKQKVIFSNERGMKQESRAKKGIMSCILTQS